MRTRILLLALALVQISCSQDADRLPEKDGAGGADAAAVDLAAGPDLDVGAAPKPDTCQPGCHWDCFSSEVRCYLGKVWSFGRGPVPCCQPNDPWPYGPGPACSSGSALYACKDAKCQQMDTRYEHCINPKPPNSVSADKKNHPHLFQLFCAAEAPLVQAGHGCATDADCRPMDASVKGRLTCDTSAGKCVETARPAAAADLGKTCGIKETSSSPHMKTDIGSIDPKTGTVCHFTWDSANKCLAQGITVVCKYDEDCPTGMVCVCVIGTATPLYPSITQICAVATARDTVAGRTAGLKCH